MALDEQIKLRLERALAVIDDQGARGTRLLEDARRLCGRVRRLIRDGALPGDTDSAPMELSCYALQLPLKNIRTSPTGKLGRTSLVQRCEQAAEMLVGVAGDIAEESLLDATSGLLGDMHQKRPSSPQAALLADAMNLDDFGISGLILQAILIARQGGGVATVADGCEKREQYGYWEARLKDGFHFDQSRHLAKKRLDAARRICAALLNELREDGAL